MLDQTPVPPEGTPVGGPPEPMDRPGAEERAPADNHSLFLDTSTKTALAEWNDLLRLQVDFFAPSELDFLATFGPWKAARRVLDVGCGNGSYTSALRARFPRKTYIGIDLSEGLISEARCNDAAIDFEVANFLDYRPSSKHDLIVMRFLVQHLTNFGDVLEAGEKLLEAGGGLLIIEPDVKSSRNSPATPLFEDLLSKFEKSRENDGRMRTRIADPQTLVSGVRDWALADHQLILIRNVGPPAQRLARALYLRWIDTFERSGLVTHGFDETRKEIQCWATKDRCSSNVVLRAAYLVYQPT